VNTTKPHAASAPPHRLVGQYFWNKYPEIKPTESDLIGGRACILDDDGILMVALFDNKGQTICHDTGVQWWASMCLPNSVLGSSDLSTNNDSINSDMKNKAP